MSKLSKNVKIVQNCQSCKTLSQMSCSNQWLVISSKLWLVLCSKIKRSLSQSVSEWVTRSPIGLSAGQLKISGVPHIRHIISPIRSSIWDILGFKEHHIVQGAGKLGLCNWRRWTRKEETGPPSVQEKEALIHEYMVKVWNTKWQWSKISLPSVSSVHQ